MKRIYFKSEIVDWYELSTPEDKDELRGYIKREDTDIMYGGKDTGVVLYMRDGTFKQASYATIELLIDDAIAWARCDVFKRAKYCLNTWREKNDPLFKLSQAANIYRVDLEENAANVHDWYSKAHIYPDDTKVIHADTIAPTRALFINPANVTDETADSLYSLWINLENGFVYFICAKDSSIDCSVKEHIPAAENINLTTELTNLYNNNVCFRDMCKEIVKRLENKE